MVDKKRSDAQVAAGETFVGINDEIAALKKGKCVDDTYSLDPNSANASADLDQFYGMQPNSFPGQTPPPSSVHVTLIRPVQATGQTGPGGQTGQTSAMVQNPPSPTPIASIPSSAAPSRTGEMVFHTGPCDTSGVSTFKYNQCTLVKVKRKI